MFKFTNELGQEKLDHPFYWLDRDREYILRLTEIGGGQVYHQEGNALTHTLLVTEAAIKLFGDDKVMVLSAFLHDIGKIETGYEKPNGDWAYPGHSEKGAEILSYVYSTQNEDFIKVQWYVRNHIKPLFWKNLKDVEIISETAPEGCSVRNLAGLAYCDLMGSWSAEPQTILKDRLLGFYNTGKISF